MPSHDTVFVAENERLLEFQDHGMQCLGCGDTYTGVRVTLDDITFWRARVYSLQHQTAKNIMKRYLRGPHAEFEKHGTQGFLGFVFLRERLFGLKPTMTHPKDHVLMRRKMTLDAYNDEVARAVDRAGDNTPFKGPARMPKTKTKKARETAPRGRLQSEKVHNPIVQAWAQRESLQKVAKENGVNYLVV